MSMSMTVPLADARNRLSPLVASVESTHERVVITRNGRPAAVLVAVDDLEGLEDTLEILSEPHEVAAIREALADPARYTLDDIRRDLEARESRQVP